MTYLAESDVLIDYLGGHRHAFALLERLEPDGLNLSILTFVEVYQGIYRGNTPRLTERRFREVLRRGWVIAVRRGVARRGARIRSDYRAQGHSLPMIDVLIAATAIHHDLILVTRNPRHYQRIPNLKTYQEPEAAT
jgi:tRNA(fMet)-specific endonuclease VapC